MAQTIQNFNSDSLSTVKDTFQLKDCSGTNIGSPQDVLKTVVINQQSVKDCNSDDILAALQSINTNTDTVETLIISTNSKFDLLIAEQDKELLYTPVTKYNNGVNNFYAREVVVYDSETQLEISRILQSSSDGVVFAPYVATGLELIGWYSPVTTPVVYNNNETQVNVGITPIILTASTYHSVSVVVLKGTATIDNNGIIFTAPVGYSNTWEADTLLLNPITVTPNSLNDVIVIDTIN